jgi:carboxypeptidase Q
MPRRRLVSLLLAALAAAPLASAPLAVARAQAARTPVRKDAAAGPSDSVVLARLRAEGFDRSRVMETAIRLSDGFGPRLAGSPGYRAAAEWARAEMASYGMRASLEPWGTRRGRAWTVERQSVELVAPYYARLVAYPKAWSPATAGVVRGVPKLVQIRNDSDLVKLRGTLRGAIVMNGRVAPDTNRFTPSAERFSAAHLDSLSRLTDPGEPRDYWDDAGGYAENVARRQRLAFLLKDEGVAVLLEPSRNPNAVGVASYQAYDTDLTGAVPAMIVAHGDYLRLQHLVERDLAPTLEIELRTRSERGDSVGYNVIADLPGSDPTLAAQVVMVGGHFDSWTAGTGATDNAAGAAVAMEALRLLTATGARPRRTIRVALWDGEEHEDYFGSLGYVRKHLGDPETMRLKPAHATVSAYFNFDNGTGRVRGVYLQNNAAVRPIFARFLAPFADLGATTLTIKNVGSTDHMPFTSVGIPAFTFIQDPIDYETRTHHTNLDVAANLLEQDLKQAAVVTAAMLYQTANLDALLPRAPLPKPRATP